MARSPWTLEHVLTENAGQRAVLSIIQIVAFNYVRLAYPKRLADQSLTA